MQTEAEKRQGRAILAVLAIFVGAVLLAGFGIATLAKVWLF